MKININTPHVLSFHTVEIFGGALRQLQNSEGNFWETRGLLTEFFKGGILLIIFFYTPFHLQKLQKDSLRNWWTTMDSEEPPSSNAEDQIGQIDMKYM